MQPVRRNKLVKKQEVHNQFKFSSAQLGTLYVDPAIVPDGLKYAYFVETVNGKPDIISLTNAAREGWRPVPGDRHPELNPLSALGLHNTMTDNVVRNGGQILLELPLDKFEQKQQDFNMDNLERTQAAAEANHGQNDPTVPWHVYANDFHQEQRMEAPRHAGY